MFTASINNLTEDSRIYTSNAWYFVYGDEKTQSRILIDTGCDPRIIYALHDIEASIRKNPLDIVIITHDHHDHSGMLPRIRELFSPRTYAFSINTQGVENTVRDKEIISAGECMLEILYVPGHSSDSICVYCPELKVMFTGDTTFEIRGVELSFESGFITGFENICKRKVESLYPGHGKPVLENVNTLLDKSLRNLKNSKIIFKN